jgi:hypothetical protein
MSSRRQYTEHGRRRREPGRAGPDGPSPRTEFATRLVLLLIALTVLHVLRWPAPIPLLVFMTAVAAWALLGWNARRPTWMMGVTVALTVLIAQYRFEMSWLLAVLLPLWIGLAWAAWGLRQVPWQTFLEGVGALLEAGRWLVDRQPDWMRWPVVREGARWIAAFGAGVFVFHPYLHDGIVGAADAVWYTSMTADHVLQWRQNLGPVFVGQTEFAAVGNVMPLRAAPLFQHVSVVLDFITFRSLAPYLLQNLTVLLAGASTGLSAYLCLAALAPSRRGTALLLAMLYVSCPGLAALAYTGDMFMSLMTLPFLPIVFAGIIHSFRREDSAGPLMIAIGCAGCWLGHAPIGFWTTATAGASQLVRFWFADSRRRWWCHSLLAGVVFLLLCGYVFVSVSYLNGEGGYSPPIEVLVNCVRRAFPGALLPVSAHAAEISDYQLGYGLWLVLAGAAFLGWRWRDCAVVTVIAATFALLALTLPVPFVTEAVWRVMPRAIVDLTNACPMQRLYPVIAMASVTAGIAVLAEPPRRLGPGRTRWVVPLLLLACVWSIGELRPFFRRSEYLAGPKSASEAALKSENRPATRYAVMMLSERSPYFSQGVMDYELEQRLLTRDGQKYLQTNVGSIVPSHDHAPRSGTRQLPGTLHGELISGEKRVLPLVPTITLEPGKRYLLAMDFFDKPYEGVLQLKGEGFHREYMLPWSGKELAFGAGDFHSGVIPLHTSSKQPLELTLTFVSTNPAVELGTYRTFARWELIPYERDDLPIRLESMFPYVAHVRAPAPAVFETFRHFTPGWKAWINGEPVPVQVSRHDLVSIPVEAGESRVELRFEPPPLLLSTYWTAVLSWAGVLGYGVIRGRPRR